MDQLPRLGKRELICLLLFTYNYVVFVWRGFLFLWVLGMGYVILLWHSLSLPYNYFLQPPFVAVNLSTSGNFRKVANSSSTMTMQTCITHSLRVAYTLKSQLHNTLEEGEGAYRLKVRTPQWCSGIVARLDETYNRGPSTYDLSCWRDVKLIPPPPFLFK